MRQPRVPQWREPPKRIGPIEDRIADHDPPWLELIERNAGVIVAAIAVVIALIAGMMWGADLIAGHLHV